MTEEVKIYKFLMIFFEVFDLSFVIDSGLSCIKCS